MSKRKVIIELAHSKKRARAFAEAFASEDNLEMSVVPSLRGISLDEEYGAVPLAGLSPMAGGQPTLELFENMLIDDRPQGTTWLVRGEIDEGASAFSAAMSEEVVGIFADVAIQSFITCGNSPPVGTHRDVETLLFVPDLQRRGMTGKQVAIAVVDTGINLAHLNAHGKNPRLDVARSWMPTTGITPGNAPVNHGTMCAFDVCIAAPECTLLDIGVLLSQASGGTVMEGLLSDAVRAYAHLLNVLRQDVGPGKLYKSLVVSNSWGMFHPSWDYPPGNPGNYSDNPQHPFNRIVGTLERAGADILFAAGNCGRECPDGRCRNVTNAGIFGANSHPQVLSIAGADTHLDRVGYSTSGPGRIDRQKPDVTGYTHFDGSQVYPADSGTSAATPVVAGLVGAVRSKRSYDPQVPESAPEILRRILCRTATDRGTLGFDFDYGFGIVHGKNFADAFAPDADASPVDKSPKPAAGRAPCCSRTQTANLVQSTAAGSGVSTAFLRTTPDSSPGLNTLTINGLPAGTRSVSAWMTEWVLPNNPHAGDARFDTISVQLFNNGTQCRVVYNLNYGSGLPSAVQLIYGS